MAAPEPGPGEVLLRVLACGVCGSDLHHFAGRAPEAAPLVYGHEFAAEVVAYGPDASGPAPGTRVVAVPQAGGEIVGLSERYPGGFAEQAVVAADMLIPIPADVPTGHAALTEPLAVGVHAAAAAPVAPAALVLGCGPIGLAVIAAVKAAPVRDGGAGTGRGGAGPPRVIAADLSGARRELALRMGADEVVDPGAADPCARLAACLPPEEAPGGSLRKERSGPPAVVFECVGVPGMMRQVFAGAPPGARVVVAGACMEPDTTVPGVALVKELTVAYVFGYTRAEFAAALDAIGSGTVDPAPLITGRVGLDGVADAFTALADPERHAKILVHPQEATP
jgi:threonine dehydrogenase-like Zn-dependent dehydrogenase